MRGGGARLGFPAVVTEALAPALLRLLAAPHRVLADLANLAAVVGRCTLTLD